MPRVTLEALRWRDPPAQATVTVGDGPPRVHLQATAPRRVAAMCQGRPAEELPRILSLLSPAHSLCAARALDRLFGVEPPPVAANAREALRLALTVRHHLRKLWFVASSAEDPFADFWPEGARGGARLRPLLEELMRHVSLAQEAAAILGGRADHPVTAVVGGVSRALKPEHLARLAEIAAECRGFAGRVAATVRERLLGEEILGGIGSVDPGPLHTLALAPDGDAVVVRDGKGAEVERFAPAATFDKIGLHQESWSHEPFAFLTAEGWKGLDTPDALFLVGPLARRAGGSAPRLDVAAAYEALVVELQGAADALVAACAADQLTGPALRTIPKAPGREGHAALESPQGLVCHHIRADARGLVEEIRVLDAATANNALSAIVAQRAVEASLARGRPWDETKRSVELALLAY